MVTPSDYGMPGKFQEFREGQLEAIEDAVQTKRPYTIQIAPTGVGKSLIYVAAMKKKGGRTVILTSTKGLQDQLVQDFAEAGIVEIRGRNNYRCLLTKGTADHGLCRYGMQCGLKDSGCPYYDALREANQSRLVVTNYAYWFRAKEMLVPPDNLVLDEAHDAPSHLFSMGETSLSYRTLGKVYQKKITARELMDKSRVGQLKGEVESMLAVEVKGQDIDINWFTQLSTVHGWMTDLLWILRNNPAREMHRWGITVGVRDIKELAERFLFREVPKVILTSATVNEYTAELLGLPPHKDVTRTFNYDSPFPTRNRPFYVVGRAKIDRNTTKAEIKSWAKLIANVLRARQDRKGIIHTVSYKRQQEIQELIGVDYLSCPDSKSLVRTINEFKRLKPPAVLVSPAVTTGYDFPGDECSFQIVSKVPFPNTGSYLWRERVKANRLIPFYLAWQSIVQATGRGVRGPNDKCETFMVDWHFKWLHQRYKRFAPKWFLDTIKWQGHVPKPIPIGGK